MGLVRMYSGTPTLFLQNKALTKSEADNLIEKLSQRAMMLELCGVAESHLIKFMNTKLDYENMFFKLKQPYNKKVLDLGFEYSHSKLFYYHRYLRVFIRDFFQYHTAKGIELYSHSVVDESEN